MAKKKADKKTPLAQPRVIVGMIVGAALIFGGLIGYKVGHHKPNDRGNAMDMWDEMRDGKYKGNWRRGNCEAIHINTPQKGQRITSPMEISVTVDNSKDECHWSVFEGQAGSVELKNQNGDVIGTANLTTTEDWTTDEPINFKGTLPFTPDEKSSYTLVINEENPSGQSGKKVMLPLMH
jgi:Immunoglobulin-like domain of bacterial spore germination